VAVELEVGILRRRPVGQNKIEPVQREVAQEVVEAVLVAEQAQVRLLQHRLQQRAHRELVHAVRKPDDQPHLGPRGGIAHGGPQVVAKLEDLLRLPQRHRARLGQSDASPRGLQQRAPELALQFPYLRADRLHRHAQPGRGARHAAFLGDHPEIVEMPVAEREAHTSIIRNELFVIVCFFGKPSTAIVVPS
jgi:hypothetical protein